MQFLRLLTIQLLSISVCSGDTEILCTNIEPCTCKSTRSTHFQVDVDCHGKDLKVADLCDICVKVKHIRSLDVSLNEITNIPASCFEKCTDLEDLNMGSNNISKITKGAFSGLNNLKTLYLNNNTLIKGGKLSDPQFLQPLESLESLQIQGNVKELEETGNSEYLSNLVKNTTNLRSLHLDGVPNGRFGPNFLAFKKLASISFSGIFWSCNICNLTNTSFENVPYMKRLDLSACNISHIDAGTFEPLGQLQFLNLSYNMALGFPSLRNVSFGLRNSMNIRILDFSKVYKTFGLSTQLNRCDLWYLQNTALTEIHINGNRLASIELNALELLPSTLETVFMEDNKISFGPFALQLGCLTSLKRLEVNRQDIPHPVTAFNDEVNVVDNNIDTSGGCPVPRKRSRERNCSLEVHKHLHLRNFTFPQTLKTVGFCSSNLRYEPSSLPFPVPLKNNVETFDLSNNIIYVWNDSLVYFGYLKNLNLSNNFCSYVSGKFFENCPEIEILDASYNKLGPSLEKDINGSIFKNARRLKMLNISTNWIEKLPKNIFIYLTYLEHLDLSFNQLEDLEFKFEHMKNLSSLILRQNKIGTLPLKLLEQMKTYAKKFEKNVTIDLSDNVIDAEDCKNMDFLLWIIQNPNYFAHIDTYKFYINSAYAISYPDLKSSIRDRRKHCQTYTLIIVLSSSFIMVSISIIIGGILFRYRWRLRYLYYMTKARHSGYVPLQNSVADNVYQYDVFISYATDNYQFVTGEMYNELKEAGLSLCLHQKDFLPGQAIAENIVQAVRNSRMTLVVLSPDFLKSKWCIYEFNMARMESIYSREGITVVFVVMYESVDLTLMSAEMRDCLESESYLAYPTEEQEKSYFWRVLKQALARSNSQPIN